MYNMVQIINDVKDFLNKNFYGSVKYIDLINNCDLSKGNCMDVTEELFKFLSNIGYDNLKIVTLYEPKFSLDDAHSEYQHLDNDSIFHEVLLINNYMFIDLTGSQFGKKYGGFRILSRNEVENEWNKIIFENQFNSKRRL